MAKFEVAGDEPLITPAELAAMYKVDAKTTARWAKAGRIHGEDPGWSPKVLRERGQGADAWRGVGAARVVPGRGRLSALA